MTGAVSSSINFYVLHIAGTVESSVVPADGTITLCKIQNDAITGDKLANNIAVTFKDLMVLELTPEPLEQNISM